MDTGCSLKGLLGAMDDGVNGERESRKSVLARRLDDDRYIWRYNGYRYRKWTQQPEFSKAISIK